MRARVGDSTYTPEVRRRLLDLSRPRKSWLVRRVWQNVPAAPPQLLAQRHPEGLQARWSGVLGESSVEVGTSAPSVDLLWNGQMLVVRTTKYPAYPIRKLVGTKKSIGLDHFALAVDPFGFYGVKPRTLLRKRRQLTILTPSPLFLTWRLCLPSQRLTSLETCQLALSQIRSRIFLPAAPSI